VAEGVDLEEENARLRARVARLEEANTALTLQREAAVAVLRRRPTADMVAARRTPTVGRS
jgi:hypothetical protein